MSNVLADVLPVEEDAGREQPATSTGLAEPPPGSVISRLERTHMTISNGLEKTVKSIDNFFADDKSLEEATESYLRMALDIVSQEYGGTGFAGDLKLRADLPRTEKRLKLLIETDEQRGSQDNLNDVPSDVVQERDLSVALERQVGGERNWDIRPALGIRGGTPLDTFARVRTYRNFDLDTWLLRASHSVSWFHSRGYGIDGALEFDRHISENFLFRTISSLSWKEDDNFREFDQGISLYQRLSSDHNMAYQIGGFADDEFEWRSISYFVRVRYRKRLHKQWMFAEIIPQWSYFRENGFRSEGSLTLRLEMVFGENYR